MNTETDKERRERKKRVYGPKWQPKLRYVVGPNGREVRHYGMSRAEKRRQAGRVRRGEV